MRFTDTSKKCLYVFQVKVRSLPEFRKCSLAEFRVVFVTDGTWRQSLVFRAVLA